MAAEEEKVLFACLLLRDICAALETIPITKAVADQASGEEVDDVTFRRLPPSVVISALSLVRLAGSRLAGNFECVTLAEACLFAASKVGEYRLRVRDIGRAGRWVEGKRRGLISRTLEEECETILHMELKILAVCGFIVPTRGADLVYRLLYCLSEIIIPSEARRFVLGAAWAYLNDAFMINLSEYQPLNVAATCIALAAQDASLELPTAPAPWWEAVDVDKTELEAIALRIYEVVNVKEWPVWIG